MSSATTSDRPKPTSLTSRLAEVVTRGHVSCRHVERDQACDLRADPSISQ